MSSVTGGRGTFPGPPGPPRSSGVETESIELVWSAPSHSGGSGIQGYRIDVRTGGAIRLLFVLGAAPGEALGVVREVPPDGLRVPVRER